MRYDHHYRVLRIRPTVHLTRTRRDNAYQRRGEEKLVSGAYFDRRKHVTLKNIFSKYLRKHVRPHGIGRKSEGTPKCTENFTTGINFDNIIVTTVCITSR